MLDEPSQSKVTTPDEEHYPVVPVIRYTDAELETLLRDVEAERVERKEAWAGDAPEKGRQAICAFANDLPDHRRPGVLFVGARNDGTPANTRVDDQLLVTLASTKTDGNILPPPTLVVEKRRILGADVAVVTVQPSDSPPVRYKGRIWVRIGPRRGIATAQDERILNEKRRHGDRPFDIQTVPTSSLADLSRTAFVDEYLPAAVDPELLAANERTYEERLAAAKMVGTNTEPTPTVLGLLVLGTSPRDWVPGAYVQFVRVEGTEDGDPVVDELLIDGTISQVLRRVDEKIAAHNTVSVDFTSGARESRRHAYPPVALQQLVRNAVMHRTYEATNAPVRVYWYDDRLEIQNPGGPYGVVTVETFGRHGVVDYRNPNLAEAMRTLGFVQRFGMGIALARRELAKNENPEATFLVEPNHVLCTLRPRL